MDKTYLIVVRVEIIETKDFNYKYLQAKK